MHGYDGHTRAPGAADIDENDDLRDQLLKPRSIFTPGHHIRMNFVPIFVNVLVPWFLFTVCAALTGFQLMFYQTGTVIFILVLLGIGVFAMCILAQRHRLRDPDPTWYTFFAIMLVTAFIVGIMTGYQIYDTYTKPYYEILDLKTFGHLNPNKELGSNVLDAGIVHFAEGSKIDATRSCHFNQETVYCVAPVTINGSKSKPDTLSYDFWAVGKDCCAIGASDFRCGSWEAASGRGAIRALDEDALQYYRLAVQQAETLYDIVSAHPVFFYWSQDPLEEIYMWNEQGFRMFLFISCCAFLFCLIATASAVWRFALMGRSRSAYKYAEDMAWNAGVASYGGADAGGH